MAANGTIQLHSPTAAITPLEPTSLNEALALAETLAKSALVPSSVRGKPADIFVILATGRELGIGPMQALSDINVIQGKPVFSADLMVAQCKKHPEICKYIRLIESTEKGATYETLRVGSPEPERFTFTMDDARKLGLDSKDNYKKQPKTMLRRRAAAALAREVYPDLVRGYDPDEAEDFAKTPRLTAPPASVPAVVEGEAVHLPDDPPSATPDDAPSLADEIRGAATQAELVALLPAIKAAPDVEALRPLYNERMRALKEAH